MKNCVSCNKKFASMQGLKQHLTKNRCKKDTSICESYQTSENDFGSVQENFQNSQIRDLPLYKKIVQTLYNGNGNIIIEQKPNYKELVFTSIDEFTLIPFNEQRKQYFINRFIECYTYSYQIMNVIDGISKCISDYYLLFDGDTILYKTIITTQSCKCFYMNTNGIIIEDESCDFILQLILQGAKEQIILSKISCKVLYLVSIDKPYYTTDITNDYILLYNSDGLCEI